MTEGNWFKSCLVLPGLRIERSKDAARGPPGGTESGAASSATDFRRFLVIRLLGKGLERSAIIVADLPEGELGQLDIRLTNAVTRAMASVRLVGMNDALQVVVS
jgi:hypothetical protein